MPEQAGAAFGFGTPFAEQLAFFRAKLNLPTERWDDIRTRAHDRAFIVAGAAKADLLTDLRGAVDQAVQGGSIGAFRKSFAAIVAKHGWTGWTGEGSAAGVAWRTRVIYQTNLATSYAAGRHQQLTDPDMRESHPFWEYVHSDSVLHPRPQHAAWNGLTLPVEHGFWKEHFPPNGWGCRCRVRARGRPTAGAPTQPPQGWDAADPKTGAPVGVDKGFDYAPGASAKRPLQELIDEKLFRLDAPIGAQMWAALKPVLLQERTSEFGDWARAVKVAKRPRGETRTVGAIDAELLALMDDHGVQPASAQMLVRDEDVLHTFRDSKKGALPWDWYLQLPTHVDAPAAVILDQTVPGKPALLYVFDLPDTKAKLVLTLDYLIAARDAAGKKRRALANIFRSGRTVDSASMDQPGYVLLKGAL